MRIRNFRVAPMGLPVWLGVVGALSLLGPTILNSGELQVVFGTVGLGHCLLRFWSFGGRRISAQSVTLFASGLFCFFAGIFARIGTVRKLHTVDLVDAMTVVLIIQVLLCEVVWQRDRVSAVESPPQFSEAPNKSGLFIGLGLLAIGVLDSRVGVMQSLGLGAIADSSAYVGVVLIGVVLLGSRTRFGFSLLFVGLAFAAYSEFVFAGFGRLNLGSLGIIISMLCAQKLSFWGAKASLPFLAAPALLYLARARVEFTAGLNPGQSSEVTGLESVLSPLYRFSQLMQLYGESALAPHGPRSFFASALVFVPREWWPDKPIGLGAELAQLFSPQYVKAGQSDLALLHGEWLWAFGFVGLVLLVPAFGWFVGALDRLTIKAVRSDSSGVQYAIGVAICHVFTGALVDLFWGGSFTYASRVSFRVFVLVSVFIVIRLLSRISPHGGRRGARHLALAPGSLRTAL